jgi:hypothetical protein
VLLNHGLISGDEFRVAPLLRPSKTPLQNLDAVGLTLCLTFVSQSRNVLRHLGLERIGISAPLIDLRLLFRQGEAISPLIKQGSAFSEHAQ